MNVNEQALEKLQPDLFFITDQKIKKFTIDCILNAPGEYWKRPSAFYKGHHPEDELGEWGNLRHVKKVLVMGRVLAEISPLNEHERNLFYAALTVHDIGKYGIDGRTERIQSGHADLVSQIIAPYICQLDPDDEYTIIQIAVTHMGRWGNIKPYTHIEQLGHYADCIASRTVLTIPVS